MAICLFIKSDGCSLTTLSGAFDATRCWLGWRLFVSCITYLEAYGQNRYLLPKLLYNVDCSVIPPTYRDSEFIHQSLQHLLKFSRCEHFAFFPILVRVNQVSTTIYMSLHKEAELGRNSAQHLLRSADENLKAKEEMMFLSFEAPLCLPRHELFQVLLAQNHPGRELRETCEQPKLREPPPAIWQSSVLPEALPGCSAAPKNPPLPRAWAWPAADARARDEALRRQPQGCLSKPAQRNPFGGETLALQLSSMTPAGAEGLQEDG